MKVMDIWFKQIVLLECHYVVTGLNILDALTHRLDDASTFVTKNNGESTLGIFSRKSVCI